MNKMWIWVALAAVVGAIVGWFGRGCCKGNKKVKDEAKELAEEAKEKVEETAEKVAEAVEPKSKK